MPEAKEVFAEIENRIKQRPEKVAGLNATYQFDLTGESWTLQINNGAVTVHPGAAQTANTTFVASTDDWMNIATGKLNPVTAFMQQKLKVKGDMGLAMKLQGLLQ
jgi:putative sterol carrier protein